MRDIEIHYNPYKMKTTMRIEGLMYARAVIIAVSKKYYIAIRRKVVADGETHQIVKLPGSKAGEEPVA